MFCTKMLKLLIQLKNYSKKAIRVHLSCNSGILSTRDGSSSSNGQDNQIGKANQPTNHSRTVKAMGKAKGGRTKANETLLHSPLCGSVAALIY